MNNVDKAFALARLGIKVFPVATASRRPLISEKDGGKGFYDGTSDDLEQIATWFTGYAEETTEVGVWMGGSGLIAADLDRGKKSGKDGFVSLAAAERAVSETHSYATKSGGEHHIYRATALELAPGADVLGMEGVDIRAGGSYVVWWGDEVPDSREAFSTDVPQWMTDAATASEASFSGEGFSGSVETWLGSIPDDIMPSGRIRDFMARIPSKDFGHPEMVQLAWEVVRLGSERETGVKMALNALRDAWLRKPYDTTANRRDLDIAVKGGINKGGRVQTPVPPMSTISGAKVRAEAAGSWDALRQIERKVSETSSEIDFARARREMFKIAADSGLSPSDALGIIAGSKSIKLSKASIESAWFGDGETHFQDKAIAEEEESDAAEQAEKERVEADIELSKRITTLSMEAGSFSFLTEAEKVIADAYDWFGRDYLGWVKTRLKHFNKAYHVGTLWAVISVIASPWGKVPLSGSKPTDCNLYINVLGDSSSGKSQAFGFGTAMIDAYYGVEHGPIIGDVNKMSALALHRSLILRDGQASMVYGDEIQSFFQGVQTSQWQNGILGDISSHYGGDVSAKLMLNDKDISGKRAKTMLTTYLTGIVGQTLDAISINQWTSGLFYRFLWGFGEPRNPGDFKVVFEKTPASYTAQLEVWAREFRRVGALQEVKWGAGRVVQWEEDANDRINRFLEQIDEAVRSSSLYDDVFVAANGRFADSIMKAATLVALCESSETVKLDHVLVALDYAGPWHRSMVLAVSETGKDPFDRECEKCLVWIKRNAVRQKGKPAWIQRTAVMREFKPNEIAERLLRQLTEEGWLIRSGDKYEITEG